MLQTADRDIHGATLSRRFLLRGAGALTVGFGLVGGLAGCVNPPAATVASKLASSWIKVGPDGTVAVHTGNSDFGQGTVFTAYRQIVADELYTTIEAITTVVTGDTDRTPDGGGSYALLFMGSPNIRKAAAYTYQALLDLAAQKLGAPRSAVTAEDGVFRGGGRSIAYGDLVRDQALSLTIPVQDMGPMGLRISGDPPTKPVSAYKYVGQSFDNTATAARVTARADWITDVRLPGMLHARMVRPRTLGSTLVSAGTVDKARFPGAQVVVKGNLVAVVSPNEWEAIQAAQSVADGTRWTDWKGLPGHERLPEALRGNDWAATPVSHEGFFGAPPQAADAPDRARRAIAGAARTLKASYFMPYLKHAPIGPTIAVADVRPDGTTTVHAHNQNAQLLRRAIATMLGTAPDNVVVRSYAGPGHYGRSNGGVSGAEDEAVILSKELGKPVRVQWMRDEDIQWSTQQAAAYSDIEIGLDAQGRMVGYQADHFMPAMGDTRPIGAVLAGLPTIPAPAPSTDPSAPTVNRLWDDWIYGSVKDVSQTGHGGSQIGQAASPLKVGLRDQSMRTPGQFQQNFPREAAINEAAALAGADPLAFRLAHATDPRVKGVLEAVRDASGWQTRPTPAHGAGQGDVLRGRGVSNLYREASYWSCVAEVAVTRSTGVVKVERITLAVDPGIVINPKQLKRQVEGGVTMGVSQALFEEVRFDESGVTSRDWSSYPILTMADLPEIKVVLLHKPEIGVYGSGSEAANALPAAAIVGALHDATGVFARRLPLTPAYVAPLLST